MKNITYSIAWNLFLITLGTSIACIGIKSVLIPQQMITGGFSGLGLLLYYSTDFMTPGFWFMMLNLPVFIIGWKLISRRFLLYSLYGTVIFTAILDIIPFTIIFDDPWLAVIAGGTFVGIGCGVILRSLGSSGGNDIIAIILNKKWGFRIGTYSFIFNFILFLFSFGLLDKNIILYSMATSYISAILIDYCLGLFNQRKMMFIISPFNNEISKEIMKELRRGVTILNGEGAYTGAKRNIILTVVNTYQIKRVEEIVFQKDPGAFVVTENTFNVLGKGFSQRKIY
ncbi:MAG: hypothetical protein CSB21_01865 [Deltaproteobacteria bacterium]|nr:MAG: hypothetical protein CSB21_01865 [Deltaproteobacteria bacterium]